MKNISKIEKLWLSFQDFKNKLEIYKVDSVEYNNAKKDIIPVHEKFNKELKNFMGYITRCIAPGFKQSSELYSELQDNIICTIYSNLNGINFDNFKIKIKLFNLLEKYDKWNNFLNYFNVELITKRKKLKFLKNWLEKNNFDFKFILNEFNLNLDEFNIIECGDFRTYLFTTIKGELTKFFNKYNRERKFSSIDDCRKETKDYKFDRSYIDIKEIFENIKKKYELNINVDDILTFLLHKDKQNLYNKEVQNYEVILTAYLIINKKEFKI